MSPKLYLALMSGSVGACWTASSIYAGMGQILPAISTLITGGACLILAVYWAGEV